MIFKDDERLTDAEVVNAIFKGDKAREKEAGEYFNSVALMWSDIETYAAVFPEHAKRAQEEIGRLLGYLPHENIIIPHEVFIRTLIDQLNKHTVSEAQYRHELMQHVTHIRNDDMKKFMWNKTGAYGPEEFHRYQAHLPQFAEAAQGRIMAFFDYLPDLKYRMPAEMLLSTQLEQYADLFHVGLTPMDYKVFTIIAYRKVLLDSGQDAADNSPLLFPCS